MLTLELRKLEETGIVQRTEFEGYPRRVDYALTPAGERLVPLIDALGQWWVEMDSQGEEKARDDDRTAVSGCVSLAIRQLAASSDYAVLLA